MQTLSVTPSQKRALGISTIAALIAGVIFLKPFLLLIISALVVAYIFNPLYEFLLKRWNSPSRAASTVTMITFLCLVIPVLVVLAVTVQQINHLISMLGTNQQGINITELGTSVLDWVNHLLVSLHIPHTITQQEVTQQLTKLASTVANGVFSFLTSTLGSIFGLTTAVILYIYVLISVLMHQTHIIETIKLLNPLGEEVGDIYLSRIGAMTKAMVRGQFVIALAQGVTGAALLYVAGLHNAFFLFALLLTVFSIVPLGGGIIALPIGVLMLVTGNLAGAIIVIAGHLLIVTNIDNVLRPRLVPVEARLDPALTMLSVFAGLALFGFLGIVLGPVLMIVIVTTIQVYLEVFKNTESLSVEASHRRRGVVSRIKRLFAKKKAKPL